LRAVPAREHDSMMSGTVAGYRIARAWRFNATPRNGNSRETTGGYSTYQQRHAVQANPATPVA
jgi:hypothetical protein